VIIECPGKEGKHMGNKKNELTKIVGAKNVLDNPKTLETYSRDQSFAPKIEPSVLVKPESADQVQEIVNWANQTRIPLVPVSSGPPRFRGDTVPSVAEAAIVDLSNMNKIIRIDPRNRLALIEPGVTYSQLQPELAKEGLRLSTPLLPRANKSVVASLLEREPTLIPKYQWTPFYPLRCLEVVWGDGEKFRTGDAGNQGRLEEAWEKKLSQIAAEGPGQTDFYKLVSAAQGSLGIVTWASIKCEVLPELEKLFFVSARRLDGLLDFVYRLLRFRFGDELLLLNNASLAYILGDGVDRIKVLKDELPPWVVLVGIAGRNRLPSERVEFQEKDIAEIAQQFDLELIPEIPGAKGSEVLETIMNPSQERCWKLEYKGGCQDIFFITTLDRTPEFVKTMHSVAKEYGYPALEIGVYLQPLQQGASCHCEFILPFDRDNVEAVAGIRELYAKASEELLKQGAFFSRPYGIWADMAFKRDEQTTILLKKIKGIFDPNNVMNPNKLCF
jgi:FAD/FMN-containing dehydrogenase